MVTALSHLACIRAPLKQNSLIEPEIEPEERCLEKQVAEQMMIESDGRGVHLVFSICRNSRKKGSDD